jgi:hypothetical protein
MSAVEPLAGSSGVARSVLRMVAGLWLALVVIGSLQPARPGVVRGVHREIHWVAFAGATLLLLLLSRTRAQEILAAAGILLLGASLETLQHLIYSHPMEWLDIGDDAIAALAAIMIYLGISIWRARPGS